MVKHLNAGKEDAALFGLLHLRTKDKIVLDDLRRRLKDFEYISTRWRCAAILLAAGQDVDLATVELRRGIEGSDDAERLRVFEALEVIGGPAEPLVEALAPWARFPARLLSEGARRAMQAIGAAVK